MLTFLRAVQVVGPIRKAAEVLDEARPRAQLLVEDVAFVHEQDQLDVREQLVRAHRLPEHHRVFLCAGDRVCRR